MDNLKTCPFCGFDEIEPLYHGEISPVDPHAESWACVCDHCGASPSSNHVDMFTAIIEWNTRATPSVEEAAKVILDEIMSVEEHDVWYAAQDAMDRGGIVEASDIVIAALRALAGEDE